MRDIDKALSRRCEAQSPAPALRRPGVLAAALMGLLPVLAGASTVEDLYAASVDLVAGERTASADTAQRALTSVLVKVTGLADLTGSTLVAPVLSQAQSLVQQQGFTSRRALRYVFDEAATREAVLAAGLPYWDDDRPTALVLLQLPPQAFDTEPDAAADPGAAIPGAGERWTPRFLAAEDGGDIAEALRTAAARRGLPMVLPTTQILSVAGPLEAPIAPQSAPYGLPGNSTTQPDVQDQALHPGERIAQALDADVVLIGEGDRTASGIWQVRWQVLNDGQSRPWIGGLEAGPEYLADLLASRYAAYAGVGVQEVSLELTGIDGVPAYQRTLAYLRRLDLVQQIDLRQVRRGRVMLALSSRYEAAKLERLLQLSDFLAPSSDGLPPLPGTLRFEYREEPALEPAAEPFAPPADLGDGVGAGR